MSHKARILSMLKAAGPRGVRSDAFYREFMGRGAARIKELRDEGYDITSEREGKYTRYRLVGVGADGQRAVSGGRGASSVQRPSPALSVDPSEPQLFEEPKGPKVPSAYDPYSEAA